MKLKDKAAIISGGGSGIGAATAARFASEGAQIVVMGRRPQPLNAVAEPIGASVCIGDASLAGDCDRAVKLACEKFGGVDILVCNAGGHGLGSALQTSDDDWQAAFSSNVTSCFALARAALPSLIERGGSIVVVSSLAGRFAGPEVVGYVTAKHALIGLTRSLARDYGPRGVRVNAVCPGWVITPMADEQMDDLASALGVTRERAYELATAEVPLRRPATAAEIAAACTFLSSDDAGIITGTTLFADGGASIVDVPTLAFERASLAAT